MIAEPRTARGFTVRALDAEPADELERMLRPLLRLGATADERETVREDFVFERGAVWLECEFAAPPSWAKARRTVAVRIPPEQVLAVLKACRRAAGEQRDRGEGHDT